MRVLSWCETSQKFVLSLSGGSYPKGRANLYRVSTSQGEFVSTAHHQIFSSDYKYRAVQDLSVGSEVVSCERHLLSTTLALALKSFSLDAPHWKKKDADSLERYASEARQYGQRFLHQQDADQASSPLKGGVQQLFQSFYPLRLLRLGGYYSKTLKHIRLGQIFFRAYMSRLMTQLQILCASVVNQTLKRPLARIYGALPKPLQSALMSLSRRKDQRPSVVSHSCCKSPLVSNPIIGVTEQERNVYYDMQVLNTNNYICENGFIHHNSGKTFCVARKAITLMLDNLGHDGIVTEPNYPLLTEILIPELKTALDFFNITYRFNKVEMIFYCMVSGIETRIICKSLENYERLVGVNAAWAILDEFDTTKHEIAYNAYIKILGRLRAVQDPQLIIVSTPEGFKAMHQIFVKEDDDTKRLIRAKTTDNKHLPKKYIDQLYKQYPEALISAYINGEFVNLTSGSVYPEYSRTLNQTNETVMQGEPVHIGMDFNVGKMSAGVAVLRDDEPHFVDEFHGILDTPAMIVSIKNRYPNNAVFVYPDASGNSRKSVNASESDLSLLKQAGFRVMVNTRNPRIKDRVLSMCAMIEKRKMKVNTDTCPMMVECLEKQAYDKNGEPDKAGGFDHMNDSIGYLICYRYPIVKNESIKFKLKGL